VNALRDTVYPLTFVSNVDFNVTIEPAVDYIRILNARDPFPGYATVIRIAISKNTTGRPRPDVKLIFKSATQPVYHSFVLIKQIQCPSFSAAIDSDVALPACEGAAVKLSTAVSLGGLSDYTFKWNDGSSNAVLELKALKAGNTTYTVTVSNKNSQCPAEFIANRVVTILPKPGKPIALSSTVNACPGQVNPLLRIQTLAGASIRWYDGNGTRLNTTTNTFEYLPRVEQAGEYFYFAESRSAEGCVNEDRTQIKLTRFAPLTLAGSIVEKNVSCKGGRDATLNVKILENFGSTPTYRWSDQGEGVRRIGIRAGRYTVTATYGAGCSQEFSATVTEPDSLRIQVKSIKADSNSRNVGRIDVEVSGGTPPYNYQWLKNGSPFGNTQDLSSLGAGTYQLEVRDVNRCFQASSNFLIPTIGLTKVKEHSWSALVKVFPNPTSGALNLAFDLPQFTEISVEIINVLGEKIHQSPIQHLSKGNLQINLKGHSTGMYFVKLSLPDGQIVKKILLSY
jgi:hypothetical protein